MARVLAAALSLAAALRGASGAGEAAVLETETCPDLPHAGRRVWSTDIHSAAIADARYNLGRHGVALEARNADGLYCKKMAAQGASCVGSGGVVADPTVAAAWTVAARFGRYSQLARLSQRHFYAAVSGDAAFAAADAVVCQFPAAQCELYLPFNKPIIFYPCHRFDHGRLSAPSVARWAANMRVLAQRPNTAVLATNEYERHYIRYYTGVEAQVVPSLNGYISASYAPSPSTHPAFLVNQKASEPVLAALREAGASRGYEFQRIKDDIYQDGYAWSDLTKHRAAVIVPYAVQMYTPGELYRANVPLFFPSRNLTFEWECSHGVLNERTSNSELCYTMGWCKRPATSVWLPEPVRGPYDPQAGCAHDAASVRHWLGLVDWVQPYMREVVLFDSIDDLVFKLETTDLGAVSARMAAHNAELRAAAHEAWGGVLDRVLAAPRGEAVPVSEVPDTGFYADCAVTLFEGAALRLRPHHVGPGGVELWDMNRTGDDPQAYSRALPHTIRVRMDVMIDQSAAAAADISSAAADLLFGVVACLYDSNFTVCTEFDSGPPVQTAIPASTQDSSMLSGDTLEYDAYFPVETYGHHTVESYFCELGREARTRMDMMFVEPPGGDAEAR